jgi:hypothetical protein
MQNNEPPAISWVVILLMVIMAGGFITLVVAIIRDFIKHRMHRIWTQATKFERRQITEYATHGRLDVLKVSPANTARMKTLVRHLYRRPKPLETIQDWENTKH